jgi:lysophospholipase L1-like esterase
MKKVLIVSIAINLILLGFLGFLFLRNGKLGHLEAKAEGAMTSPKPDWYYKINPYWKEKETLFKLLPNKEHEIIFLGNSLTDGCEWAELFDNPNIINRGIDGDNVEGILERISEVTESKPDKIFIEVGDNDLYMKFPISTIILNYRKLLEKIKSDSPETMIYVQSVLPVYRHNVVKADSILIFNSALKNVAEQYNVTYVNLYDSFDDGHGDMKRELSYDGVHVTSEGYILWKKLIERYVNEPLLTKK